MSIAIDVEQITRIVTRGGAVYDVEPGKTTHIDAFELLDGYQPDRDEWQVIAQPDDAAAGLAFTTPEGVNVAVPLACIGAVEWNPQLPGQWKEPAR